MNIFKQFTIKGDGAINVRENRLKFLEKYEIGFVDDCAMDLEHGNKVVVVGNNYHTKTCDAIITNQKNKALFVHVADCIPALFWDLKQEVIAVVHSGREGTFKNIASETIDIFATKFNTTIENIHVEIGPNICFDCYEVSEEIADFTEANFGKEYRKGRYINIAGIFIDQLLTRGMLLKNIQISDICTFCHEGDKYFSYRKDQTKNRFAGVICMVE